MEMKQVFFGTYALLLKIFSMALTNRQTREQLAMVAKRKGVSAKNWWSLRRGLSLSRQSVTRRCAARGPGSYAEFDAVVRYFGRRDAERYFNKKRASVNGPYISDYLRDQVYA